MAKDDFVSAQPNCLEKQMAALSTRIICIVRMRSGVMKLVHGETPVPHSCDSTRSDWYAVSQEAVPCREYDILKRLLGLIALPVASAFSSAKPI